MKRKDVFIEHIESATLFIHNPDIGIFIAPANLTTQLLNGQFIHLKLMVLVPKANSVLFVCVCFLGVKAELNLIT